MHRDLQAESVLVEAQEESPEGLKVWVTSFGLQPLFDLHGLGGSLPGSCLSGALKAWPAHCEATSVIARTGT